MCFNRDVLSAGVIPNVMSPISSSEIIGNSSAKSMWSIVSHADGRRNKLFWFNSWNKRQHPCQSNRSIFRFYRLESVFLCRENAHFSANFGILWVQSDDWWSITINQRADVWEIGLQVHQRRVLNGVCEVLEFFDSPIHCFNDPSNFRNASRLIWFLCGELSSTIQKRRHRDVQTKAVHDTNSVSKTSIDDKDVILESEWW